VLNDINYALHPFDFHVLMKRGCQTITPFGAQLNLRKLLNLKASIFIDEIVVLDEYCCGNMAA
jgi:hypothetical protein